MPSFSFPLPNPLPLLQNPLPDQLLRLRSRLQLLLQTIRPHMFFQLALLSLNGRRSGGTVQDIAYTPRKTTDDGSENRHRVINVSKERGRGSTRTFNQLPPPRPPLQPFLQTVRLDLALEFRLRGL